VEKEEEKARTIRSQRSEIESQVGQVEETLEATTSKHRELEARRTTVKREYERVLAMLRNVRELEEQLTGDVGVAKRSAYGTEDAAARAEREKRQQDDTIWSLKSELSLVAESRRVTEAQCERQKEECARASEAVTEAQSELNRVEGERASYRHKWEECMHVMSRKDAVADDVGEMLKTTRAKVLDTHHTIAGTRRDTEKERAEREKTEELLARRQAEASYVASQFSQVEETQRTLGEELTAVRIGLGEGETELQRATAAKKTLEGLLASLQRDYEKAVTEQQQLDDAVMKAVGQQSGVERECGELYKQVLALVKQSQAASEELANVRNESARVEVDRVGSAAAAQELQARKATAEERVRERESVVSGYEKHLVALEDKMKKKQHYLARLVKELAQHEQRRLGEDGGGALEAMVRKARSELKRIVAENEQLGTRWVTLQREVVSVRAKCEQEQAKCGEVLARGSVLRTRLLRLRGEHGRVEAEASGIERELRLLEGSLRRGHELLGTLGTQTEELRRALERKTESGAWTVRDAEAACNEWVAKREKLESERAAAVKGVLEAEEACLLVEKQIEVLEDCHRHTRESEAEGGELSAMRKEIQRMSLCFEELKKEERRLGASLVEGLAKHEQQRMQRILDNSGAGAATTKSAGKKSASANRAGVLEKVKSTRAQISELARKHAKVSAGVERVGVMSERLAEQVQAEQEAARAAREQTRRGREAVGELEWERERRGVEIGVVDSVARMLREMRRRREQGGKGANGESVRRELERELRQAQTLAQTLSNIAVNAPKQKQWIDRVARTLNVK
jgi:chromosome segregation ATPase